VTLRLRFDDLSRSTRSFTFPEATAHTESVLVVSRRLLQGEFERIQQQGCTLVGVAVSNLDDDTALQLALPFDKHVGTSLDLALDEVRARFGMNSVTRGIHLGKDLGLSVPLLPD
jgi:DNA polymerase-4